MTEPHFIWAKHANYLISYLNSINPSFSHSLVTPLFLEIYPVSGHE